MAKNKSNPLAQTRQKAGKTSGLVLMIYLDSLLHSTQPCKPKQKNSNSDSNRKAKIYARLRNVLRPVVAASPAGVGSRLLVAAGAGFLTVVEGT